MEPLFEAHHKTIRHFNETGHGHLLTFSTYQQKPILLKHHWPSLLSESINRATHRYQFLLSGFVYMPEHVHLLVYPKNEVYDISKLLSAIKRPFSYRVKQDLIARSDSLINQLSIADHKGKTAFRFWQQGPGHDRNIQTIKGMIAAAEYLHRNPVRRRLVKSVDQWRWSSWKHYHPPWEYEDTLLPTIHGFPE